MCPLQRSKGLFCTPFFSFWHPKTKPVLALVEAEEAKMDVEGLIARAIENTEKVAIRYYEPESAV